MRVCIFLDLFLHAFKKPVTALAHMTLHWRCWICPITQALLDLANCKSLSLPLVGFISGHGADGSEAFTGACSLCADGCI